MTSAELAQQIRFVLGDYNEEDLPVVNLINKVMVELALRKEHEPICDCYCYEHLTYKGDE